MGLLGMFIFIGGILRPFRACSRGGHGGYHYHGNTVYSLFSCWALTGIGLVAMSSAVLAGIRRATGLTVRQMHRIPAVDIKKTELWLQWYDAKLARINEKVQEKIAQTVERYGAEIHDPAVRDVWETQLRSDVNEKVNRLRERRRHYSDLLANARAEQQRPGMVLPTGHSPMVAAYLFVGEWVFDRILAWARSNPHFYYESTAVPRSVSYNDLLDGDPGAPEAHGALLDSPAEALARSANITLLSPPAPVAYIAPTPIARGKMPEPSAPDLSESMMLQMAESMPQPPQATPVAGPSRRSADFDPPPYTPVDEDEESPEHKLVAID
ncbi:hypothetical protein EV175_003033 [Coemansia sp. RSA 1933]|nr:hypothetical protein EV175_003033 [Coemansia sp. RSA 1933]